MHVWKGGGLDGETAKMFAGRHLPAILTLDKAHVLIDPCLLNVALGPQRQD